MYVDICMYRYIYACINAGKSRSPLCYKPEHAFARA